MKFLWNTLKRLHKDDRGAEGLEKILILAVIVLPLLGTLIFFSKDLGQWAKDTWNRIKGDTPQTY